MTNGFKQKRERPERQKTSIRVDGQSHSILYRVTTETQCITGDRIDEDWTGGGR